MRTKNVSKVKPLTFAEKLSRLTTRLKDPKWRRYGLLLLAGKTLGIVALFGVITVGSSVVRSAWQWGHTVVYAQTEAAVAAPAGPAAAAPAPDPYKSATAGDIINPINTEWVLLGAFLVFGVQAGLPMLE